MDRVRNLFATTLGKVILFAAAVAGVSSAKDLWQKHSAPAEASAPEERPANSPSLTLSPAPAGKPAEGEMVVKNCYLTQSGKLLCGDTEDYTDPNCRTVVIPAALVKSANLADPTGKTLRYKGREQQYRNRNTGQVSKQVLATSVEVK